jgi:hypothetical protein
VVFTGTGNWGSIPESEPEKRPTLPRKAAGAQIALIPIRGGSDNK